MTTDTMLARRLGEAERQRLLAHHRQWQPLAERDAIRRRFRFESFASAFGFMTAVAIEAERLNHHPEWSNAQDRVDILLTTHDVEGLSQRDAELAECIDSLALRFGVLPDCAAI